LKNSFTPGKLYINLEIVVSAAVNPTDVRQLSGLFMDRFDIRLRFKHHGSCRSGRDRG
jgi:hypothetical protein